MSIEKEQELALEANAGQSKETDYAAEIERLKTANERLLFESQKNKTRKSELETLEAKLSEIENKKLEESGDWQKRLGLEQERTAELSSKLQKQKEKILKGNVYNAVQRIAKDAYDVNDLLAQSEYVKMIEVDEETLEPVTASIEQFVNSLKSEKKYFFKGTKVASMADSNPVIDKPLTKKVEHMSADEQKEAMSNMIAKALNTRG